MMMTLQRVIQEISKLGNKHMASYLHPLRIFLYIYCVAVTLLLPNLWDNYFN